MTCLWVHWFFLLLGQTWRWIPLVKFSISYCILQLQFCLTLLNIFSLLIFSFCSHIIFPSLLNIFMMIILNYQVIHIHISFPLVSFLEIYFVPLVGLYSFLYLVALWQDPHIWRNSHLSQSLHTGFVQGKTFTSQPSYRFWEPLLWRCLLWT